MTNVAGYAKAIIGCVIASLGALGTALADEVVTRGEWVAVTLAGFVALGAIYGVPNKTSSPGQALDESMGLDDGHGGTSTLVVIGAVCGIVALLLIVLR